MKVRAQLITSVNKNGTLESEDLQKLREFNESKNEARKRREAREREIEEQGHNSFSSSDSDNEEKGGEECKKEECKKEEEAPPQLVQKGPVIDDDGFEVVTSQKKGRRGGK